jgi:hypothetical protein
MSEPRGVIAFSAASRWNERRNSSQVFKPAPNAVPDALRALAAFRRDDPALAAWIEEGAPNLPESEHVERFGAPYARKQRPA